MAGVAQTPRERSARGYKQQDSPPLQLLQQVLKLLSARLYPSVCATQKVAPQDETIAAELRSYITVAAELHSLFSHIDAGLWPTRGCPVVNVFELMPHRRQGPGANLLGQRGAPVGWRCHAEPHPLHSQRATTLFCPLVAPTKCLLCSIPLHRL